MRAGPKSCSVFVGIYLRKRPIRNTTPEPMSVTSTMPMNSPKRENPGAGSGRLGDGSATDHLVIVVQHDGLSGSHRAHRFVEGQLEAVVGGRKRRLRRRAAVAHHGVEAR